jgi:oligopeptide transport system substrate-binding protein
MRAAVLILAAMLVLVGCSPKASTAACAPGRTCLRMGNVADPATIDPQKINGVEEDNIVGSAMMGLTTEDVNGNVIPGIATRWETSPDGLIWSFHLRDAKWSDGFPVTADDFVFGLRRLLDPKTVAEYGYLLYFIQGAQAVNEGKAPLEALGVTALDAHTLQIKLLHPAPYLLQLTKHQTMYPAPRHIVERYGETWTKDHYVSDGPYVIQTWKLGDYIHATKNPLFFDANNVCIDDIYFYPISDSISAERRVRRGELDWNIDIQSNRIARLRKEIPDYVHTNTWLGTTYIAFNAQVASLKDKRVRHALSMAIDRDFMTKKLLRGGQSSAYSFTPPGVANYTPVQVPPWSSWPYEARQAEARRLLAAAGFGPGHPLKIKITHRNTPDPSLIMSAIQSDWTSIGVQVSLAPEEGQIAYQSYRSRAFQIADAGWIADYNDPKSFLDQLQSMTGTMNYGDYNNPAYDSLLDQADHENDIAKRAAFLARAEALMLDDAPFVPIYFYVSKNLLNPKITGFGPNIADRHRIRWMCVKS